MWEIQPGDDFVQGITEGLADYDVGLVFFSFWTTLKTIFRLAARPSLKMTSMGTSPILQLCSRGPNRLGRTVAQRDREARIERAVRNRSR